LSVRIETRSADSTAIAVLQMVTACRGLWRASTLLLHDIRTEVCCEC